MVIHLLLIMVLFFGQKVQEMDYIQQQRADGAAIAYRLNLQPLGGSIILW